MQNKKVVYNNGYQTWEGLSDSNSKTISNTDFILVEPAKFKEEAKPGQPRKYIYDERPKIIIPLHNVYSIES